MARSTVTPKALVVSHGFDEEGSGAVLPLVGEDIGMGDTGMVVASAAVLASTAACDAMADVVETAELFDVVTHLLPSSDSPPPGTIMCTCGWWVMVEPQVCSTTMMPMRAPRCLSE